MLFLYVYRKNFFVQLGFANINSTVILNNVFDPVKTECIYNLVCPILYTVHLVLTVPVCLYTPTRILLFIV